MKKEKSEIRKETSKVLKDCRLELFIKLIISICYRGTLLIIPIIWGKAIDMVTTSNFNSSYRFILITLAISVGYYISACLNNYVYYKLYNKMYHGYSNIIYSSIVENSLYSLSRFHLGEFSNIINTDIDIVITFLADLVIKLVRVLEFLIIYYYFFSIDINIFLITVGVTVITFLGFVITGSKTKKLNSNRKSSLDKKFSVTHEVFNTIKEIKGFYVFKAVNKRIHEVCDKYLRDNARYDSFNVYLKQIILGIIEVVRYGLAIYGVYLCSLGKMEVGTIIVIYTYYGKITENYEIVSTLMIGINDFKVSLSRLNKLLEFRTTASSIQFLKEKEYRGDIEFDSVLYGNKKDPILNMVSLNIKANSITVITGNPGTGKTGVFDLLMKMNRKHKGDIYIDGDPYELINDEIYYNLVSLVRKSPSFFNLSIKDNLMLVNDNFTAIQDVCKKIGIHDEIMNLKHKYDTMINDATEKISNNLKIAIAIARVLLKNSKIIMFDETVSLLDTKYKEAVMKILKDLKFDHTIIMISRDEDVLNMADKIITFENNKIKTAIVNKRKTTKDLVLAR